MDDFVKFMMIQDGIIEEELLKHDPEDREDILTSQYGRTKEEFPWIDFGDED